jgi:hypothetical protein
MNELFTSYKKTIMSVSIIITILILGFLLIFGLVTGRITSFISEFVDIISPIIIGFIIAYLSNPIVTFFEKRVFSWIKHFNIRRFISILITILLIIVFISTILVILIPSLINTMITFWETYVVNYEESIKGLAHTLNSAMDKFKFLNSQIHEDLLNDYILCCADRIANIDFIGYNYVKNRNGITAQKSMAGEFRRARAIIKNYNYVARLLFSKLKNNIEFLKLRFDVFNEMLTYNLKYFEGEVLDYYSKQVEKSLRRFNDNYNKLIGGAYDSKPNR